MSSLPSPSKSPVTTTDQLVEMLPSTATDAICVLFISQTTTLPEVSRHRMSVLPSLLKSRCPIADHDPDRPATLATEAHPRHVPRWNSARDGSPVGLSG